MKADKAYKVIKRSGFIFILSALYALFASYAFTARPAPAAGGAKLRTPDKTVKQAEAELFKGLAESGIGLGRVSGDEKKMFTQTIEREKQGILRRTTEQIYENAYQHYRAGRHQEAVAILDHIITLDPSFDKAVRLKSALSTSGGAVVPEGTSARPRSGRSLAEERFYEAIAIYKEGRKIQAIEKFEEVLALDPNHRKARYYINVVNSDLAKEYFEKGKFAYTQGRLEDALEAFYSAVNLDADGYAFLQRQITELESEVRSRKVEFHLSRSLSQLSAGSWADARASAKAIFSLDPTNKRAQEVIDESFRKEADEYFAKGDSHMGRKEYERAISAYEKVLKLGRQTAKAREKIETAKSRIRKEEEEAERRRQEEAARKETEERVKAALGVQGESALETEAVEGAEAAPSEEAKAAAEGHYQQAMKFYQTGDLNRALTELNLALKYDPNNQNAYAAKRRIEADMAK